MGVFSRLRKKLSDDSSVLDFLQDRELHVIDTPYRHIIVDNFFTDDVYQKICEEYDRELSRGLKEEDNQNFFSRHHTYDAYIYTPNPRKKTTCNAFFQSAAWPALLSQVFHLSFSNDTMTVFHHHTIGSKDGWIHHDFVSCQFIDDPIENGLNPWFHQCAYAGDNDIDPRIKQRIRSIGIVFYLNNKDHWSKNDGGETNLYDTDKKLVTAVAPINNRLLAFEISPISFHAFAHNRTFARNTISQWMHEDPGTILQRHDKKQLTTWGR